MHEGGKNYNVSDLDIWILKGISFPELISD